MRKKLLIISAGLVFISTLLYGWMLIRDYKVQQAVQPNELTAPEGPLGTNVPPSDTPLFGKLPPEVKSRVDEQISSWKDLGVNQYLVLDFPPSEALSIVPDYSIHYNSSNQIFTVILYADPLLENRQKAADELAQLLKIPRENLCDLNIQVYIPASVNIDYSGKNLSFSFCPNSVDLQGVSAGNGISNVDADNPDGWEPDISL